VVGCSGSNPENLGFNLRLGGLPLLVHELLILMLALNKIKPNYEVSADTDQHESYGKNRKMSLGQVQVAVRRTSGERQGSIPGRYLLVTSLCKFSHVDLKFMAC